ncbi:purple acid phosphatases superfamily protein [Artemisia annua]|uniref:Purple acid phosphatase n=1 Tax=Artemisia annua TaxID=35608 RepID=A0A2U1LTG1_ARTAN|nr:purple acid phosphatases superfamily protein [Artemisia annua]
MSFHKLWFLVVVVAVVFVTAEVVDPYDQPLHRMPIDLLEDDVDPTTPQQIPFISLSGGMSFHKLWFLVVVVAVVFVTAEVADAYEQPLHRMPIDLLEDDVDPTTPQQVHISLVGKDRMRISWITISPTLPMVYFGTSRGKYEDSATGTTTSYQYKNYYTSGSIHEVVIGPLTHNTVYYYSFGNSSMEYELETPPAKFPIKFAISGGLGQTDWTKSNLEHISQSHSDVFILPGDLSYADTIQPLWDSFGRLVEPLASRRPWMVIPGDRDVEKTPDTAPFTAYNARWHMPYENSSSSSNLYYSFEVSKVHVIMLSSYTDFAPGSDQYNWLEYDLFKVNRNKTPWLIVVMHAPWYSTNYAHKGEKESVGMRKSMEGLLYKARVDMVFAGHVDAYERFNRVYNHKETNCAPVHITIGGGGNLEGLDHKFMEPQPNISAFREASFGHGEFLVGSESYAIWSWHRNNEEEHVQSDSLWISSLASDPLCN